MVWFKVDDGLHADMRARRAGVQAMGLWALAGAYASDQLTDGFVPGWFPGSWGLSADVAGRLVRAGLWERAQVDDEDGWRFVDWHKDQPSRAEVEAQRRANRARQEISRVPGLRDAIKARDGDCCRYCGKQVKEHDRRSVAGATIDHVVPDGASSLDNCVVCCLGCNSRKGHRTPEQAGIVLLPPPAPRPVSRSVSRSAPRSALVTKGVTPGRDGTGRVGSGPRSRAKSGGGEQVVPLEQLLRER